MESYKIRIAKKNTKAPVVATLFNPVDNLFIVNWGNPIEIEVASGVKDLTYQHICKRAELNPFVSDSIKVRVSHGYVPESIAMKIKHKTQDPGRPQLIEVTKKYVAEIKRPKREGVGANAVQGGFNAEFKDIFMIDGFTSICFELDKKEIWLDVEIGIAKIISPL